MKDNFWSFYVIIFFSGNISPNKLNEPQRQIGLIGMLIGAGEITGKLILFLTIIPIATKEIFSYVVLTPSVLWET